MPSDILKENSSPDSIALINNHDSLRNTGRKNNDQSHIQKLNEESLRFSSDLDLELPAQFGRRSNTIEQIKQVVDDIQEADINYDQKSLSGDDAKNAEKLANLCDPEPANSPQNIIVHLDQANSEKEIPKKRYLL